MASWLHKTEPSTGLVRISSLSTMPVNPHHRKLLEKLGVK